MKSHNKVVAVPRVITDKKARVAPGDTVRFKFRGFRLEGAVTKLGPRRAAVLVGEEMYRVPYALLQLGADAADYSARERRALQLTREQLRKHKLHNWRAALGDAVGRLGACNYKARRIVLSRLFVRRASHAELLETVLHEIAHALAGYEHGHDAEWRRIALAIGCSARRCSDAAPFAPPPWLMQCPNGCFAPIARHRRRGNLRCNKCKQPVRFAPNTPAAPDTPTEG